LDTLYSLRTVHVASLPNITSSLKTGPNQTWDFSKIILTGNPYIIIDSTVPNNSPFPTASYFYGSGYMFFDSVVLSREFEKMDSTGIFLLGFTLDSLYQDLSSYGTGSFAVLTKQSVDYNPHYEELKLPLNYVLNHTDTTFAKRQFYVYVTAPMIGLNNAKVSYQTSYKRLVSTIGWGQIKLPGFKNAQDALLIHVVETFIDSVFINDSPAPANFLTTFGLKQGHTYSLDNKMIYGKGYPTALLNLTNEYLDNSIYTFCRVYVNPDTTGVDDPDTNPVNVSAYPNPANENINIRFNKTTAAVWTLNFYNSNGTPVKSFIINNPTGEVTINVNFGNETSNGVYFYNITDNNMSSRYTGKVVLVR
jgi:hypothetical protein